MVNAWSLAASILDGTFDEDYPIMTDKKKQQPDPDGGINTTDGYKHSEAWYDYKRNDSDRENPFTDAFDHMMAETVVSGTPYPQSYMADNDDQCGHHFNLNTQATSPYNDGWTQQGSLELKEKLDKEMAAHYFKYHEEEILKDIEEYVSSTYRGHYTGTSHEYRKVQTLDLLAARDIASGFCQANIIKYGSRYGSKEGKEKKDLMKVIHYAMLLLHFDDHYGKPSTTTGNIDHTMP